MLSLHRCCVCHRHNGPIEKVWDTFAYEGRYLHYHTKCIQDVSGNPEKYTHKQVDMALQIYVMIEHSKKDKQKLDELIQLHITEIKRYRPGNNIKYQDGSKRGD